MKDKNIVPFTSPYVYTLEEAIERSRERSKAEKCYFSQIKGNHSSVYTAKHCWAITNIYDPNVSTPESDFADLVLRVRKINHYAGLYLEHKIDRTKRGFSYTNDLSKCFPWIYTEQGYTFWETIADKLDEWR